MAFSASVCNHSHYSLTAAVSYSAEKACSKLQVTTVGKLKEM